MNKTASLLLLLAVVSFPFLLCSQEQATAQPQKPKDYGAGFEKFYKLGLPDVSKGKYVSFFFDGYSPEYDDSNIRSDRYKAFMLEENKQGKSIFVINDAQVIEVYDKDVLENMRKAEAEEQKKLGKEAGWYRGYRYYGADEKGRIGAKWKEADFKKELEYKIEPLGKHENDRTYEFGSLLLTAAHAYRLGYKDEANRLAQAVFKSYPPQRAVTEAIGIIAEARYDEVLDKFFIDGNWSELSKQLDTLLSTFNSGWRECPAVKLLAEKVRKRAVSTSVPELVGKDLTDEDRKLALEIAGLGLKEEGKDEINDEYLESLGRELWIFQDEKSDKKDKNRQENVFDRIKKRGMKSIPLLLALLKDDYLVKMDSLKIGSQEDYFMREDESKELALERMYESLRRPISRQDIAALLLNPLLNYEDIEDINESLDEGKEVLFKKYSEWYEQHKDKTPTELAKFYLTEGNYWQDQERAMSFLMENGTNEDIKFIEKYMLEGELTDNLNLARTYSMERGEKGREFAKKILEMLTNEASSDDFRNETIVILNDIISPRNVREIIDEILSGKRHFRENSYLLSIKIAKEKPKDIITSLLKGALNSRDPSVSASFLDFIVHVARILHYVDNLQQSSEGDMSSNLPSIKESTELWKKLLADDRQFKEDENNEKNNYFRRQEIGLESKVKTVSEIAESTLEELYGGSGVRNSPIYYHFSETIGKDAFQAVTKARIEKILEGVKISELPQYPDPAKVSDARKQKMIDQVRKTNDEDIIKLLSSFSDEEKLAVYIEEERVEPEDEIFARFYKVANTVRRIESEAPEWNDLKGMGDIKGKALDKASCEKLLDICKFLARDGKSAKIEIRRACLLEGVTIKLSKILEEKQKGKKGEEDGDLDRPFDNGIVMGYFNGIEVKGANEYYWLLDEKKEKDNEAVEWSEDFKVKQLEFWKTVEEFCAGKTGAVLDLKIISFQGYPKKK